jgi:peptidoglycan/LPS O-acetylase OafA/YrhL
MIKHHLPETKYLIVTWSLCSEVFLYIVSFLIAFVFPSKYWVRIMMGCAVFAIANRIHIAISGDSSLWAAYFLPWNHGPDAFMLGGVLALSNERKNLSNERKELQINQKTLDYLLLIGSIVFVGLSINGSFYSMKFSIIYSYLFYSIFFYLVLLKLVANKDGFHMLSSGFLKFVGVRSYFIYIFHFPILYFISKLNLNLIINFALSILIIVSLAAISWRFLELPLINRGKRCLA